MLGLFKKSETDFYSKLYGSGKKLQRWIQKNSGTKEDAEDIIQEAIIVCQKYFNQQQSQRHNPDALLIAIGKKMWFMELRKRKIATEINLNEVSIETDNLEEFIQREEKYRLLESALAGLGAKCQSLLKFYYYHNYSMEIIAEILHLSSANVAKASKYKCLEKARELIKNEKL
jgi:RNA polymerase sigma factor (sigma-70 family)